MFLLVLSPTFFRAHSTTIKFQIPNLIAQTTATLKVYDVLGRDVATLVNEVKQPGTYELTWDASGLASGVYFYRLSVLPAAGPDLVPTKSWNGQASGFTHTRKLLFLR